MEPKIVFSGKTDKGLPIVIRYPKLSDVSSMTDYINTLSDERTFITYQGEHETIESETKFLEEKLKSIEQNQAVFLLALDEDQVIGISWIGMGTKTQKHIGTLGVSVLKDFRGQGLGNLLMETVIFEALGKIKHLEIITLEVYSKNHLAIELYKKFGFVEYGTLPNGIKLENSYDDGILMYKNIK
jgi:ribosomal protein S18 acetylase RimI-like enzyme